MVQFFLFLKSFMEEKSVNIKRQLQSLFDFRPFYPDIVWEVGKLHTHTTYIHTHTHVYMYAYKICLYIYVLIYIQVYIYILSKNSFLKIFLMWTIFKVFIELLQCCLCFMFFRCFGQEACGILASQPGIEPTAPCIGRGSLNHWTSGK